MNEDESFVKRLFLPSYYPQMWSECARYVTSHVAKEKCRDDVFRFKKSINSKGLSGCFRYVVLRGVWPDPVILENLRENK